MKSGQLNDTVVSVKEKMEVEGERGKMVQFPVLSLLYFWVYHRDLKRVPQN